MREGGDYENGVRFADNHRGPRRPHLGGKCPGERRGEADAVFINASDDPETLRVILYNLSMTKELKAI